MSGIDTLIGGLVGSVVGMLDAIGMLLTGPYGALTTPRRTPG